MQTSVTNTDKPNEDDKKVIYKRWKSKNSKVDTGSTMANLRVSVKKMWLFVTKISIETTHQKVTKHVEGLINNKKFECIM